jgi:ABC-type uncharacterized transport system permease subunit
MEASIAVISGILLFGALFGVRRIYGLRNRWAGFAGGLVTCALFFLLFEHSVASIDTLSSDQLLFGFVASVNSLASTIVVWTVSALPRPLS